MTKGAPRGKRTVPTYISKIPNEVLEKHRKDDSDFGKGLFKGLAAKNEMSVDALVGCASTCQLMNLFVREEKDYGKK